MLDTKSEKQELAELLAEDKLGGIPCLVPWHRWWRHRFFVFDVCGKHLLLSLTTFSGFPA